MQNKELEEAIRFSMNFKKNKEITADDLTKVTYLNCEFFEDYTGLSELKNLETLSVNTLPEIEILLALPKLIGLHISQGSIENEDLIQIAKLENLVELSLDSSENLTDLTPLASLKKLKDLSLVDDWQLAEENSLLAISAFTQLEILDLDNIPIEDITFLATLTNLKELSLLDDGGNSTFSDLTPLLEMKKLELLNIAGCNEVENLKPLLKLKNLKNLYIDGDVAEENEEIIEKLEEKGCEVNII